MNKIEVNINTLRDEYDAKASECKQHLFGMLDILKSGKFPSDDALTDYEITVEELKKKHEELEAFSRGYTGNDALVPGLPVSSYIDAVKSRLAEKAKQTESVRSLLSLFISVSSPYGPYASALSPFQEEAKKLLSDIEDEDMEPEEALKGSEKFKVFTDTLQCGDIDSDEGIELLDKAAEIYPNRVQNGLAARKYRVPGREPEKAKEAEKKAAPEKPEQEAPVLPASPELRESKAGGTDESLDLLGGIEAFSGKRSDDPESEARAKERIRRHGESGKTPEERETSRDSSASDQEFREEKAVEAEQQPELRDKVPCREVLNNPADQNLSNGITKEAAARFRGEIKDDGPDAEEEEASETGKTGNEGREDPEPSPASMPKSETPRDRSDHDRPEGRRITLSRDPSERRPGFRNPSAEEEEKKPEDGGRTSVSERLRNAPNPYAKKEEERRKSYRERDWDYYKEKEEDRSGEKPRLTRGEKPERRREYGEEAGMDRSREETENVGTGKGEKRKEEGRKEEIQARTYESVAAFVNSL